MAGPMASVTVEMKKGYDIFNLLKSKGVYVRKETLKNGNVRILCSAGVREQLDELSSKYDELNEVVAKMNPSPDVKKSLKDEFIKALSLGWSVFIFFFSILFAPAYFNDLAWSNDSGLYLLLGIIPFVILVWAALLDNGSKEDYDGKDYYLVKLSKSVYYPLKDGTGFSSLILPILTVVITSSLLLWFYIRDIFG